MKSFNIAVISGDGVGPEICGAAKTVLKNVGEKFECQFNLTDVFMGGVSCDKYGSPLTEENLDICLNSDSVLLGAVGGPKWDNLESHLRPEKGLLELRQKMGLYANLRPAAIFPELNFISPIKSEILNKGFDVLMVRELTGGIYFGKQQTLKTKNGIMAFDTEQYYEFEIERICHIAFKLSKIRSKKVTSVDKANILESSKLWRKVFNETAKKYPDVEINDMYVDNCAMQLVKNPSQFDVIVTSNMFGDILSDELAAISGSIGMMPSASLGNTKCGLYEPIHGSAPDIANLDMVNPIGCILSLAMMFKHSLNLNTEALAIEKAVHEVIKKCYRTKDIYNQNSNDKLVGTKEMAQLICKFI